MSSSIKNRLPFIFLLLGLIALVVYLSWPESAPNNNRKQRTINVKVVPAEQGEFKDIIEALGNVRANEQVLITSQYSDIVDEVAFSDGQVVQKGDLLVRLNQLEEQARVKELEANLAESVAQLNRFQDLWKKRATSKSQVDEQDAKTKAITAQLLIARTKLRDLSIYAPFNGSLGFREISVGSYIKSGDVITSLDDISVVKVDFSVPERFITAIKTGQVVKANNVAYENDTFIGKITSIDPRIDAKTRMVKVRAELPNDAMKLRPGMLLTITVERKTEQILQIPESAIIPIEDKHYVFVVNENKAVRKQVEVGRRKPGMAEILGGIVAGEEVVTEGTLKLQNDALVTIVGSNE